MFSAGPQAGKRCMQMDDSVLFRLLQLVSIQKIFVRTAAAEVQMRFTELHTGIALDAARLKKSAVGAIPVPGRP